jgi:hypothetical protein
MVCKNRKKLKVFGLSRRTYIMQNPGSYVLPAAFKAPVFPVWVIPALSIFLLASCASTPKTLTEAEAAGGGFAFLDPGGLVYLAVDVPRSRPVLDLVSLGGVSGKEAAQILDLTDTAVAAVYPAGENRAFSLAARGRFPSSRLKFSLGLSSSWKKARSETGGRYWRSEGGNLSVYVDSRNALISTGDPFPRTGGAAPPPRFGEFQEDSVLTGWVPDAATPVNRFLAASGIPLEIPVDLFIFGIYPAEAGETDAEAGTFRYFAKFRLELPSPSHAEALVSMISLIRAFAVRPDSAVEGGFSLIPLLFANAPVRNDSSLIMRTAVIDPQGIALLFNMFSLYSK